MRIKPSSPFLANVLVLGSCQAFFFMANTIIISTSPLIGLMLAPRPALATAPLGIQFVGTMLTTMPASLLMKRIGRVPGLMVGALLGIAAGLVGAFAIVGGSFALFMLAALLYGAFGAFGQYYRFAAADTADAHAGDGGTDRRGRAIAWVMTGGVVAAVLGPALAQATRDAIPPFVFAGCFAAVACLALLSLLALGLLRLPRPSAFERQESGRPLREIVRQPMTVIAILAAVGAYVSMNLLMTATPLAMHTEGHVFADSAFVIQWHVLGMFAPSFFSGHLIGRFGERRIVVAGTLLMLACVAVNLTGVEVLQFASSLFLLGVGWNFMFVGGTTLLTHCHGPAEKAKVQGFNEVLLFSAVAVSAASSGALHHLLGWQTMNLLVVPVLLLVLTIAMLRASPRPARGDAAV